MRGYLALNLLIDKGDLRLFRRVERLVEVFTLIVQSPHKISIQSKIDRV